MTMRWRLSSGLAAIVAAALAVVAAAAPVSAGAPVTRYVDDDGTVSRTGCTGHRTAGTIEGVAKFADPGDTVIVCDGTYPEDLLLDIPRVTVRAMHPHKATIRATATLTPGDPLVSINANRVVFRGFRLLAPHGRYLRPRRTDGLGGRRRRVRGRPGPGHRRPGTATLEACGYDSGVVINSGADATVQDTLIKDFQFHRRPGGARTPSCSTMTSSTSMLARARSRRRPLAW